MDNPMSYPIRRRENRLSDNAAAILWVTLGTALFTLVFASGKFVGDGVSTGQIVFMRYIGGLATLLAVALVRGEPPSAYRSPRPLAHLARALFGVSGGAAAIHAASRMPIVDATAIGLLHVVFVIALGMAFLGERIGARQWGGIALCCGGAAAVVLSGGAFGAFDASYAVPGAVALTGALLIALEAIMIKVLSMAERPMSVLLHVNAFGLMLTAGPALMTWGSADPAMVLSLMLLGPIAISAQYTIIRGYRLADVSLLGPVDYTWLIFAGGLGVVFFGEVPGPLAVAGCLVIVAGGCLLSMVKRG